jgi:hypothetical protein
MKVYIMGRFTVSLTQKLLCSVGCIMLVSACGGSSDEEPASIPVVVSPPVSPTPPVPSPTPAPSGSWWKPVVGTTWQWQLKGNLITDIKADAYDIDLFDNTVATITNLKASNIKVICYFSAGSSENWRSDFSSFTAADMGLNLDNWPGERWLDIRSDNVRKIMLARLDLAKTKGCDGVEPDNVDGVSNKTGFPLQDQDQITYNRWLADEAHLRGLSVGLKNDTDQISVLAQYFDFAVNEECHEQNECNVYSTVIAANKPVFNAEYLSDYVSNTNGARDTLCAAAKTEKFATLVLPLQLDGSFRYSCS